MDDIYLNQLYSLTMFGYCREGGDFKGSFV